MEIEESFYIGYITKTKGLKGEIQVYFEFSEPELLNLATVFLEINGKLVPYFTASVKLHPNSTGYFFLEDVDTIEKAAVLVKKKIYLPESDRPEQEDEAFGYSDLQGFQVHDKRLGDLGEIMEVNAFPQQFIAVVSYKFREVMFPLSDDFILSIDEEAGILEVDLPAGLIEVYLE